MELKVLSPTQMVEEHGCFDLIEEKSRLPDHSLLFMIFSVGHKLSQPGITVHHTGQNIHILHRHKCKKRNVPNDFLCSEMACRALVELIETGKMPRNNICDMKFFLYYIF